MIKHPMDTYGDSRSPILPAFQNTLFTSPFLLGAPEAPSLLCCLPSSKLGALSFTYVHAQMKKSKVVMKEFKSKSADIFFLSLFFGVYLFVCCCRYSRLLFALSSISVENTSE
jgi:hypothetical protein